MITCRKICGESLLIHLKFHCFPGNLKMIFSFCLDNNSVSTISYSRTCMLNSLQNNSVNIFLYPELYKLSVSCINIRFICRLVYTLLHALTNYHWRGRKSVIQSEELKTVGGEDIDSPSHL